IYAVEISIGGTGGCSQSDTIIVEYLPMTAFDGDPVDLPGCPTYNLLDNDPIILGDVDPSFFYISYHNTPEDAANQVPINDPGNYTGTPGEVIYASIMDVF